MDTAFIFFIGPRACGKSSVGAVLRERLPGWTFLDVDLRYEERRRGRQQSELMVHARDYYASCRQIVLDALEAEPRTVVALASGTLINPMFPSGDLDLLITCKKHGPMVLPLPSRLDMRSRRILYQRELARSYNLPRAALAKLKETAYSHYDTRIAFFRDAADLVLYGSTPEKMATRVAKRFNLPINGAGR